MLVDFLKTASLAISKAADYRSATRLVSDQFQLKLCKLLGNKPSDDYREMSFAGAMRAEYRLNRGDLWSLREVMLYEVYTLHCELGPFALIDLGSNIGLTSIWMGANYPLRAVVAVEANHENAALTRSNFKKNKIRGLVLEAAVGPEDGEAYFSDVEDSNMGRVQQCGRPVKMISMNTVLSELDSAFPEIFEDELPILVKMDIEGGERELLNINTSWLNRIHAVIAELHPTLIDVAPCIDTIRSYGFKHHPAGSLGLDSMDFFIRNRYPPG